MKIIKSFWNLIIENIKESIGIISLGAFLYSIYASTQGWIWFGIPISLILALIMLVIMILFWTSFPDRLNRLVILVIYIILMGGLIFNFSSAYMKYGLYWSHNISAAPISPPRSDAIYFSIVTWTTLGYGDFQPSPLSRMWASFEVICGYLFSAVFIAFLINFIMQESQPCNPEVRGTAAVADLTRGENT
jgi:hypothetical protein